MADISNAESASTGDQNQRELPKELQEAILTRLPVKSLGRFRCVSPQWRSLTHHRSFIARHNHLSPLSLLTRGPRHNRTLPVYRLSSAHGSLVIEPRTPPPTYRRPVGYGYLSNSLHGLVAGYSPGGRTYVLNPATRELARLPRLPGHTSPFNIGLAFDPSTQNYTVVIFYPNLRPELRSCLMLTLGTDTDWRCLGNEPPMEPRGEAVFANRAVHWVVFHPDHRAAVLAVDVGSNEMRVIPPPEPATVLGMFAHNFEGCLAVSVRPQSTQRMTIWVMREHDEWTKECVVDLSVLGDGYVIPPRFVGVVEGRLLIQWGNRGSLYAYDPRRETWELCCEAACGSLVFYKESLLSPKELVRA